MPPPTVFVTRRIFDDAVHLLQNHATVVGNPTDRVLEPGELEAGVRAADGVLALLTDKFDATLIGRCPNLKVVSNVAVGFDNIDVAAATERGILVTNTPGVLTETTADFAWCLMLAAARRVVEADRFVRDGHFTAWGPRMLLGYDLFGKTLGIIGLGRIGQAVARRAAGFGMQVVFNNARPVRSDIAASLGAKPLSLRALVEESDFISVHVPLSETTHHLIGRGELELMKPTAILVNTSRGPVVDERALVEALSSGKIAAAGLDVYEREPAVETGLIRLPNAVLAPHIGSSSHETRLRMCMMAAENLWAALKGERPPNLVNPLAWKSA